MNKQTASEAYALIIGIDDYSAFDGTLDGPNQLRGSVNDVRAWWRVCRSFDFAPQNIRVVTSPALELAALPGASPENIHPATGEHIRAGAHWIAHKLREEPGSVGLVVYSGHGYGIAEEGLWICPTDTTLDDSRNLPRGAIKVDDLEKIFRQPEATTNLTVVFDCCFSHDGSDRTGHKVLSNPRRPADSPADIAKFTPRHVPERILMASKSGQSAFEAEFAGQRQGAFTWALTSTLGQWGRSWEAGVLRSHASYQTVRDKSAALLAALELAQTPMLYGPEEVGYLPFLHPGDERHLGETSEAPDGPRHHIEINPNWAFYINFYTGVRVAVVPLNPGETVWLSNGDAITGDPKTGSEFWLYPSNYASLQDAASKATGALFSATLDKKSVASQPNMNVLKVDPAGWASGSTPIGKLPSTTIFNGSSAVDFSGSIPVWYSMSNTGYVLNSPNTSTWTAGSGKPDTNWYTYNDTPA